MAVRACSTSMWRAYRDESEGSVMSTASEGDDVDSDRSAGMSPGTRRRPRRAWAASLVALGVGLLLTTALVGEQLHRARLERAQHLRALADGEIGALQEQLRDYDLALRALQTGFL